MNIDLFTFSSPCVLVSSWHNTMLPITMASVEHIHLATGFFIFSLFPLFLTASGEDRKGFDKDEGDPPFIL